MPKRKDRTKRDEFLTEEEARGVYDYSAYVGLDVHKESIVVSVACKGRREPESWGEIPNRPESVRKLVERIEKKFHGELPLLCYEAGPCGYVLYRQLTDMGFHCQVVAPSRIPKIPGDRVKTDKRDAKKLAVMLRGGHLTPVWVPDERQEAMRDLVRARADMKELERRARQRVNAYVLRNGYNWPANKSRWTKTHYDWLESLKLPCHAQHVALQEYINAVRNAGRQVDCLASQVELHMKGWSLAPVVEQIVALRGVDRLSAAILMAELGDISRFASPRQLAAYIGLVPAEHSSGGRRRQGGITRTGNSHARKILVECAWSYRFPARQTLHMKRKTKNCSEQSRAIGWKAQKRLCGRYRKLMETGKNTKQITVAIARELVGFIWDITCKEMDKSMPGAA